MATQQDIISQFLARKGGATVCPPTVSHKDNARSLRRLRHGQEREITAIQVARDALRAGIPPYAASREIAFSCL